MQHPDIQMFLAKEHSADLMREASQARLAAVAKAANAAERASAKESPSGAAGVRKLLLRIVTSISL
jgi:hypothetical protein